MSETPAAGAGGAASFVTPAKTATEGALDFDLLTELTTNRPRDLEEFEARFTEIRAEIKILCTAGDFETWSDIITANSAGDLWSEILMDGAASAVDQLPLLAAKPTVRTCVAWARSSRSLRAVAWCLVPTIFLSP